MATSPRRAEPPEEDPTASAASAAAGSSTGSSDASSLIADAGPVFDPGQGEESEDRERRAFTLRPGEEAGLQIEWQEGTVRGILVAQGSIAHKAFGKTDQDWVYTDLELKAIAGPLTRILNRYDATRAAAGQGDEIALALGLGGYTMRSYRETRDAIAAAKQAQEQAETSQGDMPGVVMPFPATEEQP